MEPTPDDMADTMSATYRGLRDINDRITAVLDAMFVLQLLMALVTGAAAFYLLRKLTTNA